MKNLIKLHQFVNKGCDIKEIFIDGDTINMIEEKGIGASISLINLKNSLEVEESPSEIHRLINKDPMDEEEDISKNGISRKEIREIVGEEIHKNIPWIKDFVKTITKDKMKEGAEEFKKYVRNEMKEQKWNDWWGSLDGHD